MKKILLTAVGLTAFSSGFATADSNYVGLGFGWAGYNLSTKNNMTSDDSIAPITTKSGKKVSLSSTSQFAGAFFLGRRFEMSDSAYLLELKVGQDLNNSENKYNQSALYDGDAEAAPHEIRISLRRKWNVSLSLGYSQDITRDVALYGKVSLTHASFSYGFKGEQVSGGTKESFHINKKSKSAFGFGATVGVEKKFSDCSLGLDYTFDIYKRVKFSGNSGDSEYHGFGRVYSSSIRPIFHTVMVSFKKSF